MIRARLEAELARTYRLLFHYETLTDLRFAPAWLSTMGQCDCLMEILRIEIEIAKIGFPPEKGLESH